MFVKEHLPPLVSEEGRVHVSLLVWRPKETFEFPNKPLDHATKVLQVVTGIKPANEPDPPEREPPIPPEIGGTVITAVTPLIRAPDEDLEHAVSQAFDRCLEEIALLVRAYILQADDVRVRFLSRRNVYPIIPYALRDPFKVSPPRHKVGLFTVHEGVSTFHPPATDLDASDVDELLTHLSGLKQGHPFQVTSEHAYRARRMYWVDGDYTGTITAAYTAGEVLVNSVLLMTEWEKGTRREVTRVWFEEEGLAKRLRTRYHPSLGGNWNPSDGNGVIGKWIAMGELRGRIVHAGYVPTEQEARHALDLLQRLVDFVKDRLVARRAVYPRTTLILLGEPGPRRRNAWGGQIERFARERASQEAPWIASYRAWLNSDPPRATLSS